MSDSVLLNLTELEGENETVRLTTFINLFSYEIKGCRPFVKIRWRSRLKTTNATVLQLMS